MTNKIQLFHDAKSYATRANAMKKFTALKWLPPACRTFVIATEDGRFQPVVHLPPGHTHHAMSVIAAGCCALG